MPPFLDSKGDSRGTKSTGTHIHMDNTKGYKIPIGTCFFHCSLIVKVHPPEREVEGGGWQWEAAWWWWGVSGEGWGGRRWASWPLSRRLTNLCLMIGAMNPGTKGLQPSLAAKGLQAAFTQAFCPTFWEEVWAGRARKKFHTLCAIINSSTLW